ncbi:MAG TPA: oligosaccharide flippase family protein [Acidimicrobiales bacterium]|nr:oligosaccharide flippase family protein [Acidimicrobiales bacterium]
MGAPTRPSDPDPEPTVESAAGASTTGANVLAGGLWYSLNQTLPQLYTLVQSVVAARVLGPADMGRQSYIAWATLTIRLLVSGGFPPALVQFVGETLGRGRPGEARDVVRFALRIELVAAVVCFAIGATIGVVTGSLTSSWLWAALAGAFAVLHAVPHSTLIGTQRFREATTVGLTQGAVATVATATVLLAGGGIPAMFAVEALAAAMSLVWTSTWAARALREVAPRPERAPEVRRRYVGFAAATSGVVVLELIVWKRSEFFFLERFAAAPAIAQYSIAFATATAIVRLPQAFGSVLSPAIATLHGANAHDRIRSGFSRALRLVLFPTLPITAGVIAVGPTLLQVVYGSEYRRAGGVLLVMMVSFPLVPLATLGTALLQGVGRVRATLGATIAAATVDVALALLLIPRHQEIGAAWANVGAQLTAGIVLLTLATRTTGALDVKIGAVGRVALAAALAGVAGRVPIWAFGAAGLVPGIAAGAATFAVATVAIRALPYDDARWLEDAAGHRLRGLVGRYVRMASPVREPS